MLENLNSLSYTNLNILPTYGSTYSLVTQSNNNIATNFIPYQSPVSISNSGYIAFDANDTLYIVNQSNIPSICKFVNNALVNINYTFIDGNVPQAIAFDASGLLYITVCARSFPYRPSGASVSEIIVLNLDTLSSYTLLITNITFNELRGLAFDSSGNLFVADRGNNIIIKIQISGGSGIGTIYTPYFTGLNGPMDIAVDSFNNLYIANSFENNIIKVIPDGTASIFCSGLNNPTTLLFNKKDNILYVANYGGLYDTINTTYVVQVINNTTYNYLQVPFPFGLASDSLNNVYTTSANNNGENNKKQIEIWKLDTYYVGSSYVTPYYGDGYRPCPDALAFDASLNLFIAEYNQMQQNIYSEQIVYVSNPTGSIFKQDATSGTPPALFYPLNPLTDVPLINPTSIIFDSSYTLYVANTSSNNIITIDTNSNGSLFTISGATLNNPSGLVFDNLGKLYIANYSSNNIIIVTINSPTTGTGVIYNIMGSPILNPNSLDFDETFTNLFISNAGYNNILKVTDGIASIYNTNGATITSPSSVLFNNNSGNLFVTDNVSNNIISIANNNTASIINNSNNIISLNQPTGMISDNMGNLYIANYGDGTVVKVNINISYNILYVGTLSQLNIPEDIAVYDASSSLFICNNQDEYINIIDVSGNFNIYDNSSNYFGAVSITIDPSNKILYVLTSPFGASPAIYSIDMTQSPPVSAEFILTGIQLSSNLGYIRYSTNGNLYISDLGNGVVIQIIVTDLYVSGNSSILTFTGPTLLTPYALTFDSNNNLYISDSNNNDGIIIQVNLNTLIGITYATIHDENNGVVTINGIVFDSNNNLYAVCNVLHYILGPPKYSQFYIISGSPVTVSPFSTTRPYDSLNSVNYIPWENSLVTTNVINSTIDKLYLTFSFSNLNLGIYDDTLSIFSTSTNNLYRSVYVTTFNIYDPYILVTPNTINQNTPTNINVHFVIPNTIPNPTDCYVVKYNGSTISSNFCNNCTFNNSRFIAGTYPIGIAPQINGGVFASLKNNTISTINDTTINNVLTKGVVVNNFVPVTSGLNGPISLVEYSSVLYVLNTGINNNGYISTVKTSSGITIVSNTFFTGILNPICMTINQITGDYIYVISGVTPNVQLTRILLSNPAIYNVVQLIGAVKLYNPKGLTIDNYNKDQTVLYVSDTNPIDGSYVITAINLTVEYVNLYFGYGYSQYFIDGLSYQPFTMTNNNDGYLYIANQNDNNLSKIKIPAFSELFSYLIIDPLAPYRTLIPGVDFEGWAVAGISNPTGLCFDLINSEILYVANGGTNPNNTRISKIYTYAFPLTNVNSINTGTLLLNIFDNTTNNYVTNGSFYINV